MNKKSAVFLDSDVAKDTTKQKTISCRLTKESYEELEALRQSESKKCGYELTMSQLLSKAIENQYNKLIKDD